MKWTIVGQVGNIIKKDNCYLINIAENKYKPPAKKHNNEKNNKEWEKDYTIWYNCISEFQPKVNIGDTIIAEGETLPSKSDKYPFVLKINHIGIIKTKEK